MDGFCRIRADFPLLLAVSINEERDHSGVGRLSVEMSSTSDVASSAAICFSTSCSVCQSTLQQGGEVEEDGEADNHVPYLPAYLWFAAFLPVVT
jgi:hypothetical protein